MTFNFFWQWWQFLIAIALVGGLTIFAYRNVTSKIRTILIFLRFAAFAIVLFCLLEPIRRDHKDITPPANLLFLIDRSQSMTVTDLNTDLDRLTLVNNLLTENSENFIADLRDRFPIHFYQFDQQIEPISNLTKPIQTQNKLTDLNTAIIESLQLWRGQPIAGVVLITDGANNVGTIELEKLRHHNVPIYPIGVGDATPPKDLELVSVESDPIAYLDHATKIRVNFRQIGFDGERVQISLRQNTQLLQIKNLLLTDRENETIEFEVTPEIEGTFQHTIALPKLPDELTTDNNEKSFTQKVVRSKLRVLCVEGTPRWDFTFLKRSLDRDANIAADFIVLRKNAKSEFPSETDLLYYDVVILGDLTADRLPSDLQIFIKNFVEKQGRSIIFLGGKKSLSRRGLIATELSALFPIEPNSATIFARDDLFAPKLTTRGKFHSITRLGETDELNNSIWNNLPLLTRRFTNYRMKRGAIALANYATKNSNVETPIVILQSSGLGKSLCIAAEGLWRWGFQRDLIDSPLDRFWGQTIRFLATRSDVERLKITTDKNSFTIGQKIDLTVHAYDENYQPMKNAEINLTVSRPDGSSFPIRPNAEDQIYRASFSADQRGNYRISAETDFGKDQTSVIVENQTAEFTEPQLNEKLLRKIAEISDGEYLPISEIGQLPELIRDVRDRIFETQENPLWNNPIILLIVVGLLGSEWFLRKQQRLI